ncbi:MAG: hypothetical protein KR126chlam6_01021 [Candidatus Anoxychlamydiales bacterium]|nr:hypothetical protein [Candidatus Anoxychlamydiales bacterium]
MLEDIERFIKMESIWINLLNKINTFAFPAPVFLFESSFNLAKRFVIDLFNEARKKSSLKSLIPTFFTSSLGLTTNKINTFIEAKKTSEVAKKYCITPADDLDLHAALAGSYRTYPA